MEEGAKVLMTGAAITLSLSVIVAATIFVAARRRS